MLMLNAFIMAANDSIPVVVHPVVGTTAKANDLSVTLVAKIQNLAVNPVRDSDIKSPKSVNIAPGDSVFFINSLEGCRTPVRIASSVLSNRTRCFRNCSKIR